MSGIKAVVRALRALRSAEVVQLRRQRNSLSHISRLPVEVMSTIFAEHLAARFYVGTGRSVRLLAIASVCRTWHETVFGAPLWSDLDTRVAPSFFHMALEKSKSALISVTGPIKGEPHSKENFLATCLQIDRWSSIRLTAPCSDDFEVLEFRSAPKLKILDVSSDLRRPVGFGGG